MTRVFVLLLDSFGIGEAEDAHKFGDQGGDTLGHIAAECAAGRADREGVRKGPLQLPNMARMGLLEAYHASTGKQAQGMQPAEQIDGAYGYAVEQSFGKDTPSGHWEIAGVPVLFDWGYFAEKENSFPQALLDAFIERTGVPGILGNCHASGTVIINELGDEHVKTGKPILYTSADSVLQIACHEESFGLQRLYEICEIARELVDEYNVGRVIARPFVGANADYVRTANRRDYSVLPPAPTLLNKVVESGGEVNAVGKVADIYAHSGISKELKADGNMALFDVLLEQASSAAKNSLTFVNFVDFDSKYGHRRDVIGYAHALETLDKRLPEFEALMQAGDLAVITADHGCDPTFAGTDHTREHIPVVFFGPACQPGAVGRRETFADIGQTLASHLGLKPLNSGVACF